MSLCQAHHVGSGACSRKMAKLSMYMSNLAKVGMDFSCHAIYRGNHVGFS